MNVDMVTALEYVVADCLSVKNVESTSNFLASYNKRKLYCFFYIFQKPTQEYFYISLEQNLKSSSINMMIKGNDKMTQIQLLALYNDKRVS